MANSAAYNAHHREMDVTYYSDDAIVARYQAGRSFDQIDIEDAKRIIAARAAKMQMAAE
jgi:hypothetical protein